MGITEFLQDPMNFLNSKDPEHNKDQENQEKEAMTPYRNALHDLFLAVDWFDKIWKDEENNQVVYDPSAPGLSYDLGMDFQRQEVKEEDVANSSAEDSQVNLIRSNHSKKKRNKNKTKMKKMKQ